MLFHSATNGGKKKVNSLWKHSVPALNKYADRQCVPQFDRNAACLMGSIKLISKICETRDEKHLLLIRCTGFTCRFIGSALF
jgi:hypothetical protein